MYMYLLCFLLLSGINRYFSNLKSMLGYEPCWWWKFCWTYSTPVICVGVFIYSLVKYEPLTYLNYVYPWWGQLIGWILAMSSMLCIPGYAVYLYIVTPGNHEEVMI